MLAFAAFIVVAASRLPRIPVTTGVYAGGDLAFMGIIGGQFTPGASLLNPLESMRYFFPWEVFVTFVLIAGSRIPEPNREARAVATVGFALPWSAISLISTSAFCRTRIGPALMAVQRSHSLCRGGGDQL